MKRLLALSAAAIVPAFALSAPAAAQDAGGDRVNTLIIYGDDPCPKSTPDEITVCARLEEEERFRIPETLRQSDDPANESWASRVQSFEAVGDFGPLSCSPVGAGGELGCTAKMIETAYEEKATAPGVRFNQLIAEAREERLSTIDAEAAATQARVEEIEREYIERREREGDTSVPGEVDPSAPPVIIAGERQPPVAPAKDTAFEEDDGIEQPPTAQAPSDVGLD